MKKAANIFLKTPSLHLSLFFACMIVSGFALFVTDGDFSGVGLTGIRITVGITLLMGLLSIYVLSANREQKIVYVKREEQKKRDEEKQEALSELSQLQFDKIKDVLESTDHSPQEVLNEVCGQLQAGQGVIYTAKGQTLELRYGYALSVNQKDAIAYEFGEGLVGRVAEERKALYIDKLPKGYMTVFSGLGAASPSYLAVVPIANEESVYGVLEVSTFHPINKVTMDQLHDVGTLLLDTIKNIIE
ncbi:MAG TPA: GAF domain-containing protein [Cyclobacteriaceae bacterium]|nr:GAF domain-containing protein [Cyclobacteriaceae bacterium]MCB0499791.1 GAF domain-containing protein [Cyclobacteriaceae bacterium]MCB9238599.1 GAF domain-containing protein [Flammeovirgaceae bacterium]HOO10611.1 GAF domain-containing protein [Cyclobacteriaceae bacterium]HPI79604.1 GAF domain-containing protein [Cyclobacteriaceae bacterium]